MPAIDADLIADCVAAPAPSDTSADEPADFSARALRQKLAESPEPVAVEHKPSLLGRLFAKR